MNYQQQRTKMLSECELPVTEQQVLAQFILSVIKYPDDSTETIDWQIARELINRGYRRQHYRNLKKGN